MRVVLALLLAFLPALAGASTGPWGFAQATETTWVLPNAAHDVLGGDDVEYLTNAQHERIGRRVNGGPWTWWLYAGGLTPVAEYDADFRLRKVFVYGPGHAPDHVVTYDTAGLQTARYRFVTDQAGSWNPNGGGGSDFLFYRQGADVVITKPSGDFVTVLPGGQSNGWFNGAFSLLP
ncbi:MAG: hypothetical protein R3F60_21370 [bacterium]